MVEKAKSEKKHVTIKIDPSPSQKTSSTKAAPASSSLKNSPSRKPTNLVVSQSDEPLLLCHQELSSGDSFYSSGDYVNCRLSYLRVISIIAAATKVKLPDRGSPLKVDPSTKERIIMETIDDFVKRDILFLDKERKTSSTLSKKAPLMRPETNKFVSLLIDALSNIGKVYRTIAQYENAFVYYNKAIDVMKMINNNFEATTLNDESMSMVTIMSYLGLIEAKFEAGFISECDEYFTKCFDICKRMNWKSIKNCKNCIYGEIIKIKIKISLFLGDFREKILDNLDLIMEEEIDAFHGDENIQVTSTVLLVGLSMSTIESNYMKAFEVIDGCVGIRSKICHKKHLAVAECQFYKANLLVSFCGKHNFSEAETLMQITLNTRIGVLGREHPDTAQCLEGLGRVKQFQGLYEEARKLFVEALSVRTRAFVKVEGEEPLHPALAQSHFWSAQNAESLGMFQEAMEHYNLARIVYIGLKDVLTVEHYQPLADVELAMSILLRKIGNYDESLTLVSRCLTSYQAIFPLSHSKIIDCMIAYSDLNNCLGHSKIAKLELAHCLSNRLQDAENGYLQLSTILLSSAESNRILGDCKEGLELCDQAITQLEVLLTDDHPLSLLALCCKGRILLEMNDIGGALALLNPLTERLQRRLGILHPYLADAFLLIGQCLHASGKAHRAEATFRQSIEIIKNIYQFPISNESGAIADYFISNMKVFNPRNAGGVVEICHNLLNVARLLLDNSKIEDARNLLEKQIVPLLERCYGDNFYLTNISKAELGICMNLMSENGGDDLMRVALSHFFIQNNFKVDHAWLQRYVSHLELFDEVIFKDFFDGIVKECDVNELRERDTEADSDTMGVVFNMVQDIIAKVEQDIFVPDGDDDDMSLSKIMSMIDSGGSLSIDNLTKVIVKEEKNLQDRALQIAASLSKKAAETIQQESESKKSHPRSKAPKNIDDDTTSLLSELSDILALQPVPPEEVNSDDEDDVNEANGTSELYLALSTITIVTPSTKLEAIDSSVFQPLDMEAVNSAANDNDLNLPESMSERSSISGVSLDSLAAESIGSQDGKKIPFPFFSKPVLPAIDKYINNTKLAAAILPNGGASLSQESKPRRGEKKKKKLFHEDDVKNFMTFVHSFCMPDDSTNYRKATEIYLPDLEAAFRKFRQVNTTREEDDYARDLMVSLEYLLKKNNITYMQWFLLSDTRGHDGKLTAAELRDSLNSMCREINAPHWCEHDLSALLKWMDPSADGELTEAEVRLAFHRFKNPDSHGLLGKVAPILSALENIMHEKQMRVKDLFSKIDIDRSSSISSEELAYAIRKLLGVMRFEDDMISTGSASSYDSLMYNKEEHGANKVHHSVGYHGIDFSLGTTADCRNFLRKGELENRILFLKNQSSEKIERKRNMYHISKREKIMHVIPSRIVITKKNNHICKESYDSYLDTIAGEKTVDHATSKIKECMIQEMKNAPMNYVSASISPNNSAYSLKSMTEKSDTAPSTRMTTANGHNGQGVTLPPIIDQLSRQSRNVKTKVKMSADALGKILSHHGLHLGYISYQLKKCQ